MEMSDKLSEAIVKLFNEERFHAELVLNMDRMYSNKVPTAGVCIKDTVQLHVNRDFFDKLTLDERVSILKHECEHIYWGHIQRMKDQAPDVYDKSKDIEDYIINSVKHVSLNIAADLSINCHIKGLPEGAVYPEKFKLIRGETFEWYHQNLKNNPEMKKMMGEGPVDMHTLWAESEGNREKLKAKIKQWVNEAAARARSAGRMTAEDELIVSTLNHKARDWKSDFKRFIARSRESFHEFTRKKRNRRYGIRLPGRRRHDTLRIGVGIDTSGSMSDESINQAMAEIGNMAKYARVIVAEADTEVKNHYEYNPKKIYSVKGRGGTAYQPVLDHFSKEEVDAVIYIGDMDCYDRDEIKKPRFPVLWAVIGDQEPPVSWGFRTKIEVNLK